MGKLFLEVFIIKEIGEGIGILFFFLKFYLKL